MRMLSFFLFIFLSVSAFAQNVISVHTSVGDTISKEEKVKYYLFENIPAESYVYSVLSVSGKDTLLTHFSQKDTISSKISQKEIAEIHSNIEKLDVVFSNNSRGNAGPGPLKDPSSQFVKPLKPGKTLSLTVEEEHNLKLQNQSGNPAFTTPKTLDNINKVGAQQHLPH